jgi:stage V sporulation protein R
MEYEELSKSYAYGLSKIYEMVINNDPCYAYLLRCNHLVDQKLVIAHVYAHCDFFKNNLYFAPTNRKMVDEMANHSTRIQRYVDRFGTDAVEAFIDCCLSLDNLIDPHFSFFKRREEEKNDMAGTVPALSSPRIRPETCSGEGAEEGNLCACAEGPEKGADPFGDEDEERIPPRRLRSKGYMDSYINPQEFLQARAETQKVKQQEKKRFPENPEFDVLLFLAENAPLKNWQRDILSVIREEAYYFLPQGQTKIMNEGWATYWHSRMMTEKILGDGEVIDYADHHSGTLGGSRLRLNPYKLGVELFRDIVDRWNKGRFGKKYEECDDLEARDNWDRNLGLGREKIFEVRRLYNDLTFIDTFLTEDFCRRQKFFVYAQEDSSQTWVIKSREFAEVKGLILNSLTNLGQPIIKVLDGNFENRGELLLHHQHEGLDLKLDFATETLANLFRLWKRPVHVETKKDGKRVLLSYDGREHHSKDWN